MRFCSDPESESRQRAVGLFKYRSVCGATRVRSDNPLTLINNIPLPLKLLQQIPLSHRSRTSLSLTASSSSSTASYALQNRNITKSNRCRSRPARLDGFYIWIVLPPRPCCFPDVYLLTSVLSIRENRSYFEILSEMRTMPGG